MKTHPALLLVCLLSVSSTARSAGPDVDDVFSKQKIVEVMGRVHAYQLAHPYTKHDRDWIRATYYTGVMGLYRATGDPKILAQARGWAEKHQWAEGGERHLANKKTCGQTYLELHFIEPESANIDKIRAYVDSRIEAVEGGQSARKSRHGWYYCDTLYVGPPTIAMLGKATGQQKYFDHLNKVYWEVTDHLFDEEYGLFYRDETYFNAKTENGKKVFWSRGNGWVIGGIPRVLEYLPQDNERYDDYVKLLRTMAAAIARQQGDDGLWRSNLDDPDQYPNPETSGTAFFCYAMAWGINNDVLDRDKFLPVVRKAWEGLVRHVHPDGKLGFVQPVGADPRPARSEQTHEYAMGLFLLAGEEVIKLAESGLIGEETQGERGTDRTSDKPAATNVIEMPLSDRFKRLEAPGTGRTAVQLTSGKAFCYPLYYFIPTITKDAKYLIHHRAGDGEVQLHRLNLRSGESAQLTHGDTPQTRWKNWCVESGRGVLDHRSVLNVARGKIVYFTGKVGNDARMVDVETLEDELLFTLPEDREAVGQNCTSPDGQWLVYIDSPRGSLYRRPVTGAKVVAYHFDTREQRVLCSIDCHIHHVLAYDNEHFIFCHPPNGLGMMMTDLISGKWEYLRAGDPGVSVPAGDNQTGGHVCHFVATEQGICYEVVRGRHGQRSGLYDPLTRRRFEFSIPAAFGYTHTGWDPAGRFWFWEDASGGHRLVGMKRLDRRQGGEFVDLTGPWRTFGSGQKSHFHPQLTPDRKWILFTGGDSETQTNHIFLLDVADLNETEGVSRELLSPTGEHDVTGAKLSKELTAGAIPVQSVTASESQSPNRAENTIDRDLSTLWAAEGNGQWIQHDLGRVTPVGRIFIAWYQGDRRKERFEIAVSDDAVDWKVIFDGSSSGTTSGPEPCKVSPFAARYVRVTGHGNTANAWNSMEEVLFLGGPN